MAIKIGSQFIYSINDDLITAGELNRATLSEDAGLGLPTLILELVLTDLDKVKTITEPGYVIEFQYGRDELVHSAKFIGFKKTVSPFKATQYHVKLYAILDALDYLSKQRVDRYSSWNDMKTSIEVFKKVVSRYNLTPVTSSTQSKDDMLWLQYNITDRKFLEEVVWHSYIAENDPVLSGITRTERAIMLPASQLHKKGIIGNMKNSDIIINDFSLSISDGFLSSTSGSNRAIPLHDWDIGDDELIDGSVDAKLGNIPGVIPSVSRIQESDIINDNVHKNWWKAYRQNLQYRNSISSTTLNVYTNRYTDTEILDKYEVQIELNLGERSKRRLHEVGGVWIVSSVKQVFANSEFQQHITLNKEAML